MNRTRSENKIVIQTTEEMDNWMHPQTPERKQRIKDRTLAAIERFKQMKSEQKTRQYERALNAHIISRSPKPFKPVILIPSKRKGTSLSYVIKKRTNSHE